MNSLKFTKEYLGLSYKDIAKEAGCSAKYVFNIATGKGYFTAKKLSSLIESAKRAYDKKISNLKKQQDHEQK